MRSVLLRAERGLRRTGHEGDDQTARISGADATCSDLSRANPSDVRDRILASLNDTDESKNGRIRADIPFEEAGTNQLSLRERILNV